MLYLFNTCQYVNTNIWFLERWPNAYDQSPEQDNVKGAVLLDTDGTSYGIAPNAWAVTPADIITYGLGCTFRSDWQMALCPPFREGFALIGVRSIALAPPCCSHCAD